MTVIELGAAVISVTCATVAGVVAFRLWGAGPAILAAVVAYFASIAAGVAALRINTLLLNRRPPRPVCENGKCKWSDYKVCGRAGEDFLFTCKCGLRYAESGRRFLRVLDSGQKKPYMVLNPRGSWEPDQDAEKVSG